MCGKVPRRVCEVFSTGLGSEASELKLRAKVLKLEQGFGRGGASFAWAEPCQALRGVEHAGGIKVASWWEVSYSIFELEKIQQSNYRLNMRVRARGSESGSKGELCTVRCDYG